MSNVRDAASPTNLGRITAEEIVSQPDCWTRAYAHALTRPAGLPEAGERVLVMGCGTSYYVAAAYAWLREAAKQGVTDAHGKFSLEAFARRNEDLYQKLLSRRS